MDRGGSLRRETRRAPQQRAAARPTAFLPALMIRAQWLMLSAVALVLIAPTASAQGERSSAEPPAAMGERAEERSRMVEQAIASQGIKNEPLLRAMRRVPRHAFVPATRKADAYRNEPLPIGHGQTISQPYIVAYMTEALDLSPDDTVLEIGTGSGYQAAVLAEIVETVHTIEIIEPLARTAQERLAELGYDNVRVHQGDGYYGVPEAAPFDAIIVTAAAGHIPSPLVEQLSSEGSMVIPVGPVYAVQTLIRARKADEGAVRTEQLLPVRFVPMTGRVQEGR